ncbi:hypothetical protein [Streptomyces xanthophaeus]|uniref:hypothetical protein n=1 Tax=Streptomyces xanthophaeus TaxID=67385 RepID=UPI00264A3B44|nr:hypothetical protein [Streptomyces xanthophaeus]WKD35044.1 hypothetical protein KO717_26000 [Streptomyces xanthophaeus]
MHLPDWIRWIFFVFAAVQLLYVYRAAQLARRAEPGRRTDPWLGAADHATGVVLSIGLALGAVSVLVFAAPVLLAILSWQGIRSALARRAAGAAPTTGAGAAPGGEA